MWETTRRTGHIIFKKIWGGSVERSVLAGPWVRDFAKLGLHFLVAAVVSFKAGGNPTPRMGSHLAGELSPHASSRKEVHHKKNNFIQGSRNKVL